MRAEVAMEFFYHQPSSFLIISALSPLGNEAKKIFLQSEKWYIFSFGQLYHHFDDIYPTTKIRQRKKKKFLHLVTICHHQKFSFSLSSFCCEE